MTELIRKAIDKIDKESEKLKNNSATVICSHIIDNYLKNDENAKNVLQNDKTLEKCLKNITEKAKKQAENNMAMIADDVVFDWVADYYGFTAACNEESKIIDLFDMI